MKWLPVDLVAYEYTAGRRHFSSNQGPESWNPPLHHCCCGDRPNPEAVVGIITPGETNGREDSPECATEPALGGWGAILHLEERSGMILAESDVVRAEWCICAAHDDVHPLSKLIAFGASKEEFYHGWGCPAIDRKSPQYRVVDGLKYFGD